MIDLSKLDGARRSVMTTKFTPMLASLPDLNFSQAGWIYEPKMDGMRAIARISKGEAALTSRRTLPITAQYPAIAGQLPKLCPHEAILDGEIIALNESGKPSFQQLQQRINLSRSADIERAEQAIPVYFFVFDIVYLDGYDLTGVKLSQRKLLLQEVLEESERVRKLTAFHEDGMAAYEVCVENGFEGIVAKRLDSFYEPGRRSQHWIKVKAQQTDEFIVGGFTAGQGSRSSTFGALLIGSYNQAGELVYCGKVGTGFDERMLHQMLRRMEPFKQAKQPFVKRPDEKKNVTWLSPNLVVEIKFMDWTRDGHIRTPVFLRIREDKAAPEVLLEKRPPLAMLQIGRLEKVKTAQAKNEKCHEIAEQIAAAKDEKMEVIVDGDTIEFSHLNKVMWPASDGLAKLTKRDFLKYIALLAPYSLPHLKDRPLSVVRSPDGLKGKRFYQKHWNFPIPDFVETCFIEREDDEDTEIAMCNNLASLLWFSQQGVMEHHVWLSRITNEDEGKHPDFMVFDLDLHFEDEKKDMRLYRRDAFMRVSEAATWLKEALDSVSLVPYLKTSGRNGLHVFVPIENNLAHDDVRLLAEVISKYVLDKHRDKVSIDAVAAKRDGKILLDVSPNCRGKTLVAPYSPRLTKEQTVSTPVKWEELGCDLVTRHNMVTLPERLKRLGDIWSTWPSDRKNLEALLRKR